MQNGSHAPSHRESNEITCAFCQRGEIAAYTLKETDSFLIIADHAPLVEGHLLILPKQHYTCYGDVPAELDTELFALKHEVQQFLARFYAPVVFWEHGIFRQTVFHAHLHCFPFGETGYDLSEGLQSAIVSSQEDIRTWYTTCGQYFYMEDTRHALLFTPETERYLQIIKGVFSRGIAARGAPTHWRTPQQRHEEGVPLIKSVAAKWRVFQEQGANYADTSSTR
jgi:diadenosine tetraphosphate (Ap4A) HIT family hydrolase